MSNVSLIPAKWQGTPTGQRVASALTKYRSSNAALRSEAKQALSPVMATAAIQSGAALAAAAHVYGGTRGPAITLGLGVIGIVLGSVQEDPRLVALGNGSLACVTFLKATEMLRGTRPAAPAAE